MAGADGGRAIPDLPSHAAWHHRAQTLGDRAGPGILVEAGQEKFLVDCGRGITQRIAELDVPFEGISALFLTHLHSDHIVGIPDLWLSGWFFGRTAPFRVWGPEGTREMMSSLEKAYAFDIRVRKGEPDNRPAQGVAVIAHDIDQGVVYETTGIKVTAFRVDHGPIRPAFGYRIDYAGHSVVVPGDTRVSDNLIRFSQGVGVLVWDVGGNAPELFSSLEEAGKFLTLVKPKLAVYTHYGNAQTVRSRQTYSGTMVVGQDLMSFDVGDQVTVHQLEPRPPERAR